jgi:hypothetical protein
MNSSFYSYLSLALYYLIETTCMFLYQHACHVQSPIPVDLLTGTNNVVLVWVVYEWAGSWTVFDGNGREFCWTWAFS